MDPAKSTSHKYKHEQERRKAELQRIALLANRAEAWENHRLRHELQDKPKQYPGNQSEKEMIDEAIRRSIEDEEVRQTMNDAKNSTPALHSASSSQAPAPIRMHYTGAIQCENIAEIQNIISQMQTELTYANDRIDTLTNRVKDLSEYVEWQQRVIERLTAQEPRHQPFL